MTTPVWLEILRSPAVVIFSLTIFAKFLAAPAITHWTRANMQDELRMLAQFPLLVQRLEAMEKLMGELSKIPEQLAHIEGALERLESK